MDERYRASLTALSFSLLWGRGWPVSMLPDNNFSAEDIILPSTKINSARASYHSDVNTSAMVFLSRGV